MDKLRRIEIREWRVARAEPSGLMLWFDPTCETPRLYAKDPPEHQGVPDGHERGLHGTQLVIPFMETGPPHPEEGLPF